MISIHAIPALKDNYIWIIANHSVNKIIAIDPGEAKPLLNYMNNHSCKLEAILITHHHFDHTQGIPNLLEEINTKIYARDPSKHNFFTLPIESDVIHCREFPPIQALEIPGHTLDHTAYSIENHLFTGDTLFSAGCGRIFEGSAEMMYNSLCKLAQFSDYTNLYCGHEYTENNLHFAQLVDGENDMLTIELIRAQKMRRMNQPTLPSTIKKEKKINPFLRCTEEAIISSVNKHFKKKISKPVDVFRYLRTWKDHYHT